MQWRNGYMHYPRTPFFTFKETKKMLEVSHGCREYLHEGEVMDIPTREGSFRDKAYRLCRDYLRGAWLTIQPADMIINKVSGGLSNLMYYCALPDGVEPTNGEPKRLLLRLYGNTSHEWAMETLVTENVIFTLLSESQRGPRLYGVFPGGRLEEYIEARPLRTQELADATLSSIIADKMAQIHLMDVPINKQPTRLWHTIEGWLREINEYIHRKNFPEGAEEKMRALEKLNLCQEYVWLKDYLSTVKSPVVFCHNDLQEGNILLRMKGNGSPKRKENSESCDMDYSENITSDDLIIIDFEYCSYNYRGFDLANHFCEWIYDYSNEEPPYFYNIESNQPNENQKKYFMDCYLKALQTYPEYVPRPEDTVESLMKETEAFTLASHFFWGLWSIVYSMNSRITFDYWGYSEARFHSYYRHKQSILENQSFQAE